MSASRRSFLLIVLGLGLALTESALGENKLLGVFTAWTAQTYTEDGLVVCMMWSQPEKSQGDYERRGEIYVFITQRPAKRRMDEIRFEAGYTFQAAGGAEASIDDQRFLLTTNGSTAWVGNTAAEAKMVQAMRSGRTMVVEGTSSRGTATRDTYSLYGFTAAHRAITKACGRG